MPAYQPGERVSVQPMSTMRRKIAERMAKSASEIPHFTYVEEVDITALESLRQHLNAKRSDSEPGLTPLAFLGMALVRVLRDFPQCNALYDGERNVIVRHEAVHLGIATQTGDGLKVPVVKHAEALDLDGLAAEIRRVSSAARDNTASREELSGSTITITSLGKLGGIVSTPVINMPEVGIIGVNGAGKSTLLKIISRITPPTQGRVTIRGRVSSLLEVGTGRRTPDSMLELLTGRPAFVRDTHVMGEGICRDG